MGSCDVQQPQAAADVGADIGVGLARFQHVAGQGQRQLADPNTGLERLSGEGANEGFLHSCTTQQHLQRETFENVVPAAAHVFLHVVSDAAVDAQALAVVFNELQQRQLQREHDQVPQKLRVAQTLRFSLLNCLMVEGLAVVFKLHGDY